VTASPGVGPEWRKGIPDFGQWAKPGPGNVPKEFSVLGLQGNHDGYRTLTIQHIAREANLTFANARAFIQKNGLIIHHSGGDKIQLVPATIHRLSHSGGALGLRLENEERSPLAKRTARRRPEP
jgi:hypothetical protein